MHTHLLAIVTSGAVWAWIMGHEILFYYVFAVLIEQMPPPDDKSSKFYTYFYSVSQVLAANLRRTKDAVEVAKPKQESLPPPKP